MVFKRPLMVAALVVLAGVLGATPASAQAPVKVLVFHETTGTPDPSIAAGVTAPTASTSTTRPTPRT
jgi:hypothetical protein